MTGFLSKLIEDVDTCDDDFKPVAKWETARRRFVADGSDGSNTERAMILRSFSFLDKRIQVLEGPQGTVLPADRRV